MLKYADNFTISKDNVVTASLTSGRSGLTLLRENNTTPANGSVAYISSDYNTGYMTGDIRGAWNVDTDVTTLGTEIDGLASGNYSIPSGNTGSVTNGVADITSTLASNLILSVNVDMKAGKFYSITANALTLPQDFRVYGPWTYAYAVDRTWTTTGTTTYIYQATSDATGIGFVGNSSYSYLNVDNISVKEAVPDRSVKGNGLTVHGTPTVSAVATGAELKCISGFTNSNYLQQPYNSDLDFAGDFSVSSWINWDGSANSFIVERGTTSNNNSGLGASYNFRMNSDGTLFFNHTPNGYSSSQYLYGSTVPTNTPVHVSAVRDGSTLSLYINGKLDSSSALTSVYDLTNTNAILNVGNNITASSSYMRGSLALLRISATAPSAEQIKEIYEAEKPLFQENAKCTLNGSSDAVTAMDYDDSNDELLVGTSGGLSVFKGLRRVDENTNNISEVAQQGGLRVEEY